MGRGLNRIKEALSDKIKDSERNSSRLRSNRDSWRRDMENSEVFEKGKVNKMIKDIKMRSSSLREKTIVKNVKSVNHLIKKWKSESKDDSERSRPEIEGFENLSVLKGDFIERETDENRVLVIGDIKLNENEERVLTMNPKYGVYTDIEQEDVEKELEVAGIKSRWDMRNNPEH